jgi:20S proteasome alpha/beta subunit
VDTDDAQKLYGFGRFGVAAAGFSALTDDVVRELRTEGVLDACDGVTAARTNAETLLRRFMQRFAEIPPALWPVGALLVAGYEADRMTPRIYSLHSKAAFQGGPFNWVGDERGGIAADALSRLLLEGRERRSLDEAKLFGIMAVQAAHHVDPSVGPPRSMAIVTPGHGYQDLGHEVPEFVARSRSAENRLREAFSAALTSARP